MSDEPRRIVEDPRSPEALRALLEDVRSGGPSEAWMAKVGAKIEGAGPGGGGGATAGPWALATAAVLLLGLGTWAYLPSATSPSTASPTTATTPRSTPALAASSSVDEPAMQPTPPEAAHPHEPLPPLAQEAEASAAPSEGRARLNPSAAPSRANAVTTPPAGLDSTLDEAMLLQRARRAVSADPALASRLLREHEARFPQGQLRPEREVIHIDLLRARGDREGAERAAARFLRLYPDSPHREHVVGP